VSYLNELLTGYRQGLADGPPKPARAVQVALGEADDPRQRGALLGLLAKALAARAGEYTMSETPDRP
jgi:hypothetical protein